MREIDDDALAEFGAWLSAWRRQTGRSQRAISRLADIDQAWLSRVERGLMPRASMHLIARLVKVLDELYWPIRR
jgi:transcriptional regulator with XRE-family HTH domain